MLTDVMQKEINEEIMKMPPTLRDRYSTIVATRLLKFVGMKNPEGLPDKNIILIGDEELDKFPAESKLF